MRVEPIAENLTAVSLDDKWSIDNGRILIGGVQAIARALLAQSTLDRRRGLNTAGYVTGYRGSPLGGVDSTLWSIGPRLEAASIKFQPGLNEDIAATAIHGTQQLNDLPDPLYDGVFAAWYGKGPGVDRSGDAFKHGNYAGTHKRGGVLLFYGDDHAGKSSTVAHQSEQAIAASLIPSLYPSNVQEMLDYSLLGIAMSRYSGAWVGVKCVTEVGEQTATIDIKLDEWTAVEPPPPVVVSGGVHARQRPFNPLQDEQAAIARLDFVRAFVRANAIDRTIVRGDRPRLGIVTAGKSYGDLRAALDLLDLDDRSAAAAGISIYKVGCIWPLEPSGLIEFASGHDTLLVVEEKKSFLEQQAASILINQVDRPLVIGKVDEQGADLFSSSLPLEPATIAQAIAAQMSRLGLVEDLPTAAAWCVPTEAMPAVVAGAKRSPYFCSGCPHNRSTRVPLGSLSMTGIGCHTMVNFTRPNEALPPVQMGGEGGNWLGLSAFTGTKHMFQNMGDGTYYHSGLLAIRAAVAAGSNITYKILYNDAVAMTGGQPVDGPLSVGAIARQVRAEGVEGIFLVSENPDLYRNAPDLPAGLKLAHRDQLDDVQRQLRDMPGCTVLIYEQTCAAEKRRRRKRKQFADPPKRLFISEAVCEGCGDCSVQSTCVSLTPVETEFGRKRAIDQASCNKDYSCLNGFCPSFITVHGAEPRKPKGINIDERWFADLPTAPVAELSERAYNLMLAGIGGNGVVTIGALLGMAAHIEGLAVSLFDLTGLAQKNGAVYSHVRLARKPDQLDTQRISAGQADVMLGFDLVAALAPESALSLNCSRTRAVVNAEVSPTVAFQFDRNAATDADELLESLASKVAPQGVSAVDASALALALLGDPIGGNLFMVGIAAQRGLLPVGVQSIERAVVLNRVAAELNLRAFRLGRLFAVNPAQVLALAESTRPAKVTPPTTLTEVVEHRMRHLTAYQGPKLAGRYSDLVARVRAAEVSVVPTSEALTLAVARSYAKLLAYKDEYEVARLLSSPALQADIARSFESGGRIAFNMAPPLLGGPPINGRPKKREFGAWMLPVLKILARLRMLRGTMFDPFGRTHERRVERQLITEYEALLATLLEKLTPETHGRIAQIVGLSDEIRGYGPVKDAAVVAYKAAVAAAIRELPEVEPVSAMRVRDLAYE